MSEGSVLLAGCGDLGGRLAALLISEGRTVIGLRRDPSRLGAGIEPFAADLSDRGSLESLPPAIGAVVYLASAGAFTEEAYDRAYRRGLANLLDALPSCDRLVFVSSTAVLGQRDGGWVNEASPVSDAAFSQRALLDGERIAREAGGVVLRLAGIYGPGRTRLLEQLRAGEASYDPDREQWTNRIHADCAAAALKALLDHPEPAPLYLGVDDEPARRREVLEWLAQRLGVAAPRAKKAAADGSRRPLSSKRCSNRLLRAAGWRPGYPSYREGYEALLAGGA